MIWQLWNQTDLISSTISVGKEGLFPKFSMRHCFSGKFHMLFESDPLTTEEEFSILKFLCLCYKEQTNKRQFILVVCVTLTIY